MSLCDMVASFTHWYHIYFLYISLFYKTSNKCTNLSSKYWQKNFILLFDFGDHCFMCMFTSPNSNSHHLKPCTPSKLLCTYNHIATGGDTSPTWIQMSNPLLILYEGKLYSVLYWHLLSNKRITQNVECFIVS